MGNVTAVVHVTGAHHNGLATDIEAMFKKFVAELQAIGHSVTHAAVTVGSTESATPAPAPALNPNPAPAAPAAQVEGTSN